MRTYLCVVLLLAAAAAAAMTVSVDASSLRDEMTDIDLDAMLSRSHMDLMGFEGDLRDHESQAMVKANQLYGKHHTQESVEQKLQTQADEAAERKFQAELRAALSRLTLYATRSHQKAVRELSTMDEQTKSLASSHQKQAAADIRHDRQDARVFSNGIQKLTQALQDMQRKS
jgi:hypothetical protein